MTARRALAYSYGEKYGSFLIALAMTMVVSRLLGPAEIGVYSVGMALVGIVAVVREFGISTYLVQEAELDEARIGAAFTLTMLTGIGLSLLILALSVPAGRFYDDADVTSVIAILALNFALAPLGSVSQALLARELRFDTLTWIRLTQGVVLALASIGFAAAGLGPQSLAFAAVLASIVNGAVSLAVRPHSLHLTFDKAALSRVFSVGGPTTVIGIVDDIVGALPELVIGRVQTLAAAGLFSRARGMSQMAHQLLARAAGPVFFAVFAERRRQGIPVAQLYLDATACIVALGWSGLAMLAVLSEPVVRVLFGDAWLGAVAPMRWLCIAAAVALLTSGAHHLLLAVGGARDALNAKLIAAPVHVAGLIAGASFGLDGVAAAMIATAGYAAWMLALAVRRRVGVSIRRQLEPAWSGLPFAIASAAGASTAMWLGRSRSPLDALLTLALGAAAGAACAAVVLAAGAHPLRAEAMLLIGRLRGARS